MMIRSICTETTLESLLCLGGEYQENRESQSHRDFFFLITLPDIQYECMHVHVSEYIHSGSCSTCKPNASRSLSSSFSAGSSGPPIFVPLAFMNATYIHAFTNATYIHTYIHGIQTYINLGSCWHSKCRRCSIRRICWLIGTLVI